MRLLYTTSDGRLSWTDDLIYNRIPPYAILSHTWGEQEVNFKNLQNHKDIEDVDEKLEEGYQKIFFCAEQAKCDGIDYFWVDTCCIDKSNSQELQEAINSMFRWYQKAEKCYVYLSDVNNSTLDEDCETALRGSRWFTRGWTLQELLAPTSVEFFSSKRIRLGDKESLKQIIHEITQIPVQALSGSELSDFSVEDRFSWAKQRQTTREEDNSYCLLGIFGVHVPMIYGEGKENALSRLNDAVVAKNNKGRNRSQEERLDKIHKWLSAPDPSTNYHKADKLRQEDTGLWLLNGSKFTEWKKRAASRLWLYGIPGCGKTILSSTIINHLLQHCSHNCRMVAIYFYFDFKDVQKQDPELMIRSLLCQLLQHSSTMPKGVDALFSTCGNGQQPPSLHALLELTLQVMHQFTHVYIILDALDECTQRQEMLDILETVAGRQLDNMHLLMTSRKERDIEGSLENYVCEKDTVYLQSNIVDEDIQRYVQERLSVDKALAKWNKDADTKQKIQAALMSGARGMFRWAVCQLDMLAKCRNRMMLYKTLATLPQTLDQTYDRILTAISEDDRNYAIRILQWLAFSMRPMSVDEVAEVVAIDVARDPAFDRDEVLEDPLEALNICSSLVTVSTIQVEEEFGPTRRIIALAHYSVREYLVSDRIKQGPARQYNLQEAECHSVMTNGCLNYLLQLPRPLSKDVVHTSALARYAAEFWSSHLAKTGEDIEKLSQLAMGLLSTESLAYVSWLQLFDPDYYERRLDPSRGLERTIEPLYYAALLGLNTITKLLLDQGTEVNTRGGRYCNPLLAASLKGHEHVVQTLLKAGADIDVDSESYGNPLQAASYEGRELIVKILLENGANINAQGGTYGNALQSASAAGQQSIVQLLLSNGADIDKQGGLYSNALNAAAAEGHIAIVELLLKNSADISRHDGHGRGVLHHATDNGYCSLRLVEFLLSQNAPSNTIDHENMTPLHYSIKFGHESIVRLLLNNGVSIDAGVYRKSWSQNTVKIDDPYQSCIPEPESDSSRNSAGLTPLHFAALTGNSVMTKFLLKCGADPNALSIYNESPIHLTLRKSLQGPWYDDNWTDPHWTAERLLGLMDFEEDDVDAIYADIATHREGVLDAILADARTSLTIRDYQNEYPLHCVEYGTFESVSMVEKLVSRGANPFEVNLKQQNALHLASRAGDHDAVAVLLSLGVEPALTDSEGLNALHHAARSGNHATFSVLLETHVATTANLVASKDTLGRNVLHHLLSTATSTDLHETIRLVLDNGVDGSELDASGNSPLASYFKENWLGLDVDICELLLSVKGSYLFVDAEGRNLGHLCASTQACNIDILETLRKYGVDLTQKDLRNRTILHCAAISGSITKESLYYFLHVVGIETSAEDISGKTALQHAAEMASKDHDPQLFDSRRWDRSMRLLSDSGVPETISRAI